MTITTELPATNKSEFTQPDLSINMDRVAAIILGGGQGTRLFPLTATRSKPAISFGGRYRLIDVPISMSLNSGCHKIFILTQFLSSSIHQHIFRTYRNDIFTNGFIELLPAEQKPTRMEWFQGTADAVRQNTEYFVECPADYFLILSGDQLYNMNFRPMVHMAKVTDADLVIAAVQIGKNDTSRMGILQVDEHSNITDFIEKPQKAEQLKKFELSAEILQKFDLQQNTEKPYAASMGIYLFKRDFLLELLNTDRREDFGKHLIPNVVKNAKTAAYLHKGYWEDIGTIESFFNANMALTQPNPEFNLYHETMPIFSNRYNLPGPKIFDTIIKNSIICEGAIIEAKEVSQCILGPRTVIKKGTVISDSYVIGHDHYKPPIRTERMPEKLEIGERCIIKKAIIDKHVFIGNDVKLINKNEYMNYDGDQIYVRDGIIVISRGAKLPDGFVF